MIELRHACLPESKAGPEQHLLGELPVNHDGTVEVFAGVDLGVVPGHAESGIERLSVREEIGFVETTLEGQRDLGSLYPQRQAFPVPKQVAMLPGKPSADALIGAVAQAGLDGPLLPFGEFDGNGQQAVFVQLFPVGHPDNGKKPGFDQLLLKPGQQIAVKRLPLLPGEHPQDMVPGHRLQPGELGGPEMSERTGLDFEGDGNLAGCMVHHYPPVDHSGKGETFSGDSGAQLFVCLENVPCPRFWRAAFPLPREWPVPWRGRPLSGRADRLRAI